MGSVTVDDARATVPTDCVVILTARAPLVFDATGVTRSLGAEHVVLL